MLNFSLVASGDSITNKSLFIPYSDIDGVKDAADAATDSQAKVISGLWLSMQSALATLTSPFGVAQAKPNPVGAGTDLINQAVSHTWSYVVDFSNEEAKVFPIDTGNPVLVIAFTDVFPNAVEIASAGTAPSDGVAIEETEITAKNGNVDLSALGDESRPLLETMSRLIYAGAELRQASNQSAFTNKTQSGLNNTNIPANFVANTTYVEADLLNLAFFTRTYSLTTQFLLNQDSGEFDVNVA